MAIKKSILPSGRLLEVIQYNVDVNNTNTSVREGLSLDINNGNYLKRETLKYAKINSNGRKEWENANPLIAEAVDKDENGTRKAAVQKIDEKLNNEVGAEHDKNKSISGVSAEDGVLKITVIGNPDDLSDASNVEPMKFDDEELNQLDPDDPEFGNFGLNSVNGVERGDNVAVQSLIYPRDMSLNQDYIYIEAFEYKAPQQNILTKGTSVDVNTFLGVSAGTGGGSGYASVPITKKEFKKDERTGNQSFSQIAQKGLSRDNNVSKRRRDVKGTVRLPIPNSIKSSNGVDWGEGRANAFEAGAFINTQGAISNVLSGQNNIGGLIGSGVGELKKVIEDLDQIGQGQSGQLLSSVLARTALSQLNINVDPSQFIARSTGMAINPNLELLFSSPKLRTFTFVFQFAPDDEDEATEVRKIQRFFKQGMLPTNSSGGDAGAKLYLGSPNVYRLCYRNNGKRIKGLNIFKICALTSCEINFTPENVYQAYEDEKAVSMPVRSFMSLTFTELTPIFANDYNDPNFDDPSLEDIQPNIVGKNQITEDDIGF